MPPPKTSFTYELDAEQQEKLLAMLALGNYRPRQVPYSLAAVEGDGFNCAKAPMDMLPDVMDNDLKAVDTAIREYWGLAPLRPETNDKEK